MQVLHIYRTYFPDAQGGLQESIRQICLATSAFDVRSKIFVLSKNPQPSVLNAPEAAIIRSKSWFAPASCDIGGINSFYEFQKATKWADVIHFHYPWPFADILNLLSFSKKPKVLTYHSDIVKQKILNKLYSPLRKHTLNSMQAIVATSPPYAASSQVLKPYRGSNNFKIIPLGMAENITKDSTLALQNSFMNDLELESSPYILFIGVLRYYKGIHILIEAAKYIHSRIIIAGSGPEEISIHNQAKRLGLNNIIFTGEINESQKQILLQNCQALVLPSHLRSEAFGMVLLEASMHAKPMISCEIGSGTSYVNLNNQTGFVVEPNSPLLLAEACNKILLNPKLSENFGQNARSRYISLFSDQVLGQSYKDVYKEVLKI